MKRRKSELSDARKTNPKKNYLLVTYITITRQSRLTQLIVPNQARKANLKTGLKQKIILTPRECNVMRKNPTKFVCQTNANI